MVRSCSVARLPKRLKESIIYRYHSSQNRTIRHRLEISRNFIISLHRQTNELFENVNYDKVKFKNGSFGSYNDDEPDSPS